jgi:hypothetical protein
MMTRLQKFGCLAEQFRLRIAGQARKSSIDAQDALLSVSDQDALAAGIEHRGGQQQLALHRSCQGGTDAARGDDAEQHEEKHQQQDVKHAVGDGFVTLALRQADLDDTDDGIVVATAIRQTDFAQRLAIEDEMPHGAGRGVGEHRARRRERGRIELAVVVRRITVGQHRALRGDEP